MLASDFKSVLNDHFRLPVRNEKLTLLMSFKEWYPQSQHVAVSAPADAQPKFPLSPYLASVNIDVEVVQDLGMQKFFEWDTQMKELYSNVAAGTFKFIYNDVKFIVHKVTWDIKGDVFYFYDLIFEAKDDTAGQKLAGDIYRWANSLKEEIWVFQNGRWSKSRALFKAIQATSWDDIVLDESFKESLRRDTDTFFSSREVYESLGITWKRGILLLGAHMLLTNRSGLMLISTVGPPGNGKTESIKALLHETKANVLYVKTISTPFVSI